MTMPAAPFRPSTESDVITFGPIHLDITTKERGLAFWQDVVGLSLIRETDAKIELGVEDDVLIVLHPGAKRSLDRNRSGLYHLALHVPAINDFAHMATRVRNAGMHQYPVDHLMHLADYVDDHDGNGLEIVFETRDRYGSMQVQGNDVQFLDSAGKPHSGREPLDLALLMQEAPAPQRDEAPAGTFLGHLHLRVADLDETIAFYRDQIGFTTNMHITGFSMFDMSAGGTFPHRLAGNVWESRNKPVKDADTAGLRSFTLIYRNPADLDAAMARINESGRTTQETTDGYLANDPSGIPLALSTTDA